MEEIKMLSVKEILSESLKKAITIEIMGNLPEWFSPPEDIPVKAEIHKKYPFYAVYDNDNCIGFVALKIHNEYTAEIYNLGVLREFHRKGGGHLLIEACKNYCIKNDKYFLTVKTLDESADYEPYDRTRAFYKKEGFIPLEVFTTYWNEENPCLFLVKAIR
jgi:ribosomal protein S18 acetylase RimI-like enzyme